MSDIYRAYQGLPGTGKTTALLEVLTEELDGGVDIREVASSTFRVPMAVEFQERAEKAVGEELPEDHYLRTTHSICYHLLGLEPEAVVTDAHREDVCDELGIDFDPDFRVGGTEAELDKAVATKDASLGNALFRIHSYCRNTRQPTTEAWKSTPTLSSEVRTRLGRSRGRLVTEFVEEYEGYKAEHGLVDFDGMLEGVLDANLAPPVDVLIEDEYQDKSALQVAVSKMWSGYIDRTYVAGDMYQAVYEFMGCDPSFMVQALNEAEETVTLDTSYRFGPDLWAMATNLLTRADYSPPKVTAVGETQIHYVTAEDYPSLITQMPREDTLHLTRANYMWTLAADPLDRAGVPFDDTTPYTRWSDRMQTLYNACARFQRLLDDLEGSFGQPSFAGFTLDEMLELARALKSPFINGVKGKPGEKHGVVPTLERAEKRSEVEFLRLFKFGPLRKMWPERNPFVLSNSGVFTQSGLGGVNVAERLGNTWRARGATHIDGVYHRISTIHGSKGQEADHVFLHNALPSAVMDSVKTVPHLDQTEARVFFVGATRARKHLWLVEHPQAATFRFPQPPDYHIEPDASEVFP